MDSTFNFNSTVTYNDSIDVEDIQNCCLEAVDSEGMVYYYLVSTDLGVSNSVMAGPYFVEINDTASKCTLSFSEYDASEYATKKEIKTFLSPKKGKIVEVKTITKAEAVSMIKSITAIKLDSNLS